MTQSALISYEDAVLALDDPYSIFLDATFVLPNSAIDPYLLFQNKRIGNAQYFSVDEVADLESHLPHMLPDSKFFEQCVRDLGISNNSKVIIYGQAGLALGPARAWWMFRIFGHRNVKILNGSLLDWEAQGLPVETGDAQVPLKKGDFQADFHPQMVVNMMQVAQISKNKDAYILDARPPERFSGLAEEPRPGMKSGHIPNSLNIPAGSLINPQTGGLKQANMISALIGEDVLKSPTSPVMTCGSGVTACVIALACYELGREDWRIYDGSWSEWGQSNNQVDKLL